MGSSLVQKDSDNTDDDIPIVKELQPNANQAEEDTEIQIQRLAHSIKLDDAVKDNDDSASTDEKTSVSEDSNVELEQSNTDNIKSADAATESAGDDV